MTRGRSAPQITADKAASSGQAALIEILFDSGPLRLVVGQWSLQADGNTYIATGGALSVAPIAESADGLEGVDMQLAGLDAAIKAQVFAEPYQGRIVRLLEQRWDAAQAAVGTPTVEFVGRIRAMATSENPKDKTMTVALAAEHFDAELEESADLRNTDAEQKRRFPTDLGCEWLASLVDRVVTRDPST